MRLTTAQRRALGVLPVSIMMWGGKPFAGMPKGVASRITLHALRKLGLANVTYSGTCEYWTATEAGRQALATRPGGET